MGKASRDKGKVGEREARDWVRKYWLAPDCIRSAQVSGSFSSDLMYGPAGLHLEVKRIARIGALRYMNQATTDAAPSKHVPTVLMRENDDTDWYVMVPMKRAEDFARTLLRHLDSIPSG